MEVRLAVAARNILGESAVWSVREQALYWVDIRAPGLSRMNPADGEVRTWPTPDVCCGVVLGSRGEIVVVGRTGLSILDRETGALAALAEIESAELDNRLNEARCDRQGRLWVGSMRDFGAMVTGSLYRVTADLRVRRMLTDIRVPNSLCWSPDSTRLYFADTGDGEIRRYDFDPDTGDLGQRHMLLAAEGAPGVPDGSTVDAEGWLWSTRIRAGQVIRVAPDGRVDRTIVLPASQPTSVAFGGPELTTLYVTTARQNLSEDQLKDQPDAGGLFAIDLDVAGLPEPEFAFRRRA